jgi:hypothetical protein
MMFYWKLNEIVSEYFVNGESNDEIESVIAEALRAYFNK